MAQYASNCKISAPIAVNVQPDVDFNGIMFNYAIGMMFPPQAAMAYSPILPPPTSTDQQPLGKVK